MDKTFKFWIVNQDNKQVWLGNREEYAQEELDSFIKETSGFYYLCEHGKGVISEGGDTDKEPEFIPANASMDFIMQGNDSDS